MEYLTNPFCEFKTHFKFDDNKKYNIISMSFFKMKKGYKKFYIYINGLKKTIKFRKKYLPNFKLRIFVDKSIIDDKEIMAIMNSDKNIQLVEYLCPNYLAKDKYYHKGTFGTLVRFFPMFDFPNNDAKDVMIWDIDLNNEDLFIANTIYQFINNNNLRLPFIYYGNMFLVNDNLPYIFAGRLYNFKRLSTEPIIEFITNIDKQIITKEIYLKKMKDYKETNIKYGIDELFLNATLFPYLIENNIKYGYYIKYGISYIFYYNQYNSNHPKNTEYLKEILGKYYNSSNISRNIGRIISRNINIKKNLNKIYSTMTKQSILGRIQYDKSDHKKYTDIIDKALYNINKITPKARYIGINFYKLIRKFIKNKDYSWINKNNIDIIEKYYMDTIYDESLITRDNKKHTYINLNTNIDKSRIARVCRLAPRPFHRVCRLAPRPIHRVNIIKNTNDYYKKKYKKYKKKYLKLKMNIN